MYTQSSSKMSEKCERYIWHPTSFSQLDSQISSLVVFFGQSYLSMSLWLSDILSCGMFTKVCETSYSDGVPTAAKTCCSRRMVLWAAEVCSQIIFYQTYRIKRAACPPSVITKGDVCVTYFFEVVELCSIKIFAALLFYSRPRKRKCYL